MINCKWKQIIEKYPNQDELISLIKEKPYKELAELWSCSIDVVKTLRTKFNLGKRNISQQDIIKSHTKEQLEDLYLNKFDRHLFVMAESLNVYQDTLSKVFKTLNIEQRPHHPGEYVEARLKISEKAKKRAKTDNPINHIINKPEWWKKGIETKLKNNSGRQPHKCNRKILDLSPNEIKSVVEERGVLAAAIYFNISQNALRDFCHKNYISLKAGPRPYLTSQETYKNQTKLNGIRGALANSKNPKMFNTSIEIALQEELTRRNITFETQKQLLNLTLPDIYIAPKIAIYADGDYWHNRPEAKPRDAHVNKRLTEAGYKVFRFWEHDIKNSSKSCVDQVVDYINTLEDFSINP